jgi:glutamate synthase domain-containing protein 2
MPWRYVIPIGLTLALPLVFIQHALWSYALLIPLALAALIAWWDFLQSPHTIRRNYPLVGRIRWIAEDLRPFAQSYFVEGDLDGRPFSHEERALVYARAKGDNDKHPFGTELDVYSDEYEWLSHSIAPDTSAPQQWRKRIGEHTCKQPYDSSLLNISAMSFGSLSARAIEALNLGAKLGGFAHNTGEGSISRYHATPAGKEGGDLIWQLGSGYFGARAADGSFDPEQFKDNAARDQVKMIEVKLSQGAKPGHGGVLPGSKVTREIAEARQVPMGQTVNSPAAHPAFDTPLELLDWLCELREMSGGKPVGIKLCVGQPHEVMALAKAMHQSGQHPDFITIDGAEGGTGAAPLELSNSMGMPLREGLIFMNNALIGARLKDKVALGASGKTHSGAKMAKAFALGADWCNAARPFMFSIGCVQSMECHTGHCPTGVATQTSWRQQGLVVEDKAPRVARYHEATLHSLREIVIAMGLKTPWDIRPIDMRERVNGARSDSIDKIYEFLQAGELLDNPDGTKYARHWNAASADTFRRVQ